MFDKYNQADHFERLASLDRWAGLLLPSLFVYAHHEEPQHYRSLPEDAEGKIVGDR